MNILNMLKYFIFFFSAKNNYIDFLQNQNPFIYLNKYNYLQLNILIFYQIYGLIINLWQLLNIAFISITLEVFHFDISDNDINELHP